MSLNKCVFLCLLLVLSSCGGGGSSNDGGTVSPPSNASPVLAPIGDQEVYEGTATTIATLSAADSDGDSLTFSLAGADASFFDITASNELVPSAVFDFEAPSDDDENNVYEIVIAVSDGNASDDEALSITIQNALEGRVVDGPVSGAGVVVTGESGSVADAVETDDEGFWLIPEEIDTQSLQVKSTGGVDTATGKELSDLVLITDVPVDASASINVNAITTVLSTAETMEQKTQILQRLGIDASPDELIASDIWEEASAGSEAAQAAQRINAQLSLIILTTQTIVSSSAGDNFDAEASVLAVAAAIADSVIESDEPDLASSDLVAEVITEAVSVAAPDSNVPVEVIEAVADAVADTNTILGDEAVDPTSETAAGISASGQEDLQEAVEDVSTGQTDVGAFEEETDPEILYGDVPTEDDTPDTDGDGLTNPIDPDDDNDGVRDGDDAFPLDPAESVDTDSDDIGNNADTDDDSDGVADDEDAFPLDSAETLDTDNDGIGNNADTDDDGDGVADDEDAFPLDPTETLDTDTDGVGNNADEDDDGDGVPDIVDAFPFNPSEAADTDGDGIGNNADTDDDGDGVADGNDAFPLDTTESLDTDGDGLGNNADTDDDGDGVADGDDAFPLDDSETVDTDGDGIGNNADTDDDGDGVSDASDPNPEVEDTDGDGVADGNDAFPLDASEFLDTDGDGVGNKADIDDDGDGISDAIDAMPLDQSEFIDSDGDGVGDNADADDDNDGVLDRRDAFPLDATEFLDTDGDGIGNNADADDDGDGVADGDDAFPLDPKETLDTDKDGIGNNIDTDDDGDTIPDASDANPLLSDVDSDSDGVIDLFDEYPNNPANFTDTDGDGIYDFFDTAPTDASEAKAVKFDLQGVDKAGISESLAVSDISASLGEPDWSIQLARLMRAVGDLLFAPATIAQDIGPDVTSELASVTNLISWSEEGSVLSNVIQSNESMFVAEAVLHPNGGSAYVLTSPSIQRALNNAGRLELQVDSCQLYKVIFDEGVGGFICLLDENDPEIDSILRSGVWRDDFLRAGISFRNDGVAVLESRQGPMLLQEDGTYQIFNEISREAPEGYTKLTETVVWLDDDHIGVSTQIFPEGGGGVTGYWTAFNTDTGQEVDEIGGTDFRVVAHDGSLYTSGGRITWTGDGFQSDGQGYAAVQDVDGNLWDKGNVYGLTLIDQERGLQLSLGEEGTEGPNIYLSSGTGTRIAYRDYAFDDDWVLSKYARHASDTIKSLMGVAYEPNSKLFIDLPAPNGAFIKLYDPDLWYYLRSGDETDDVAITYEVELANGGSEERQFVFPIEAIEDFAAFDSAIYDASTYVNGYEILEQNGEGIALEGPNPESEESAFCLFNSISQQQRCADLSGYSVLRTDLENIRNNTERHFPPNYYACPDNSCRAMPGVQNVVFGGGGLLAFFKDSADNQYYKASADLDEFMLYGDDALTITPVVNGAGESEIVASSTSLVAGIQREVDVSRLDPFEYDFETNSITIDYGLPLAERIQPPTISVTVESTGETIDVSVAGVPSPSIVEYSLDESALELVGPVTATIDLIADPHPTPMFFVKNSPLRHGWSDTRNIIVGPPDGDGDGFADRIDAFPLDPNEWSDTDSDGLGNNADDDDDGDGVNDDADLFPLDADVTATDVTEIISDLSLSYEFGQAGELRVNVNAELSVKDVTIFFSVGKRECAPDNSGYVLPLNGATLGYERSGFSHKQTLELSKFARSCVYFLDSASLEWRGETVILDISAFAERLEMSVVNPNADERAPILTGLTFGEPSYDDASVSVDFEATLSDGEESGTTLVYVIAGGALTDGRIRDEDIPATLDKFNYFGFGRPQNDGSWLGTLDLPENAYEGDYGVAVYTGDAVGNSAFSRVIDLDYFGDRSFQIEHENADNEHPTLSSLSFTVGKSEGGDVIPEVIWLGSDDIVAIGVQVRNYSTNQVTEITYYPDFSYRFEDVKFDSVFCNGGQYGWEEIRVEDSAGNETRYSGADATAAGLMPILFNLTLASEFLDTDCDGIANEADLDDDGDGVLDDQDALPLNLLETLDTDSDGVGNNADEDDDGDGVLDGADAFPLDATETLDTDGDGIGNNADADDDGDGVADISDAYPLDPYRGFSLGLSDVDGVRLSFSGVQVVDYIDGVTENTHYLDPSATNGVLDLSVPGPLDLSNLYDLVGSSNQGKAPVIRFALDSVPSSDSSGRATIITRIFDGSDAERNPGERVISATAVVDWASDGSKVTLSAPAQSSEVALIDESGVGITRNFNNADSDVMSFTDSGPNTPSTLEMKLTSYINRNLAQVGLDPSGFFTEGDYFLSVEVIGLGMFDSLNEQFTRVEGSFSLTEDPIVYIYPLPRMVSSLHASSRAEAKPSRAVDRELCAEVLVKRDLGSAFGSGGGICWVDGRPDAEGPGVNDSDPNDGVNEIQILSVSNATGGNGVQDNGVAASPKPARIIVVDPADPADPVGAGEGGS